MAKPIEEWLDTHVAEYQTLPMDQMSHVSFFRDPPRPTIIDRNFFFSGADGVIITSDVVEDDIYMDVKGEKFTMKEVMQSKFWDIPSLVINVFMSFADCHVNRIPYTGFLKFDYLDPIFTRNYPMLLLERGLLEDGRLDFEGNMQWLRANERVVNDIYSPILHYRYYCVQLADVDVDAVTHFDFDQNELHTQNERFSMIRWGSSFIMVLPLDDRYKFTPLHKVTTHVEAGIDALVKVEKRKGYLKGR